MPNYQIWYGKRRDASVLVVARQPYWAAALTAVTDLLCRLTRHRSCCHVCTPVLGFTDRWTETFDVPTTDELFADFVRWRGGRLPWWFDEHEEDDIG